MIRTAFVLGAGLGTRLRPLTNLLPKPLIPIFHKPLITFAFDHLLAHGFNQFIVNTHHLPERYDEEFPDYRYGRQEIVFRHEPERLETGGGLKNIEDLAHGEPLLMQSGDILTDMPLAPLLQAHRKSGRMVTLALRSIGGPQPITFDPGTGAVLDINGQVGAAPDAPGYVFANISVMEPDIFGHIPPDEKISIAKTWIDLVRDQPGSVGGVLIDEGNWWNIGSVDDYLAAHKFFYDQYLEVGKPNARGWPQPIHPTARVIDTALEGMISVGPGVELSRGSSLRDVIVWPGTKLSSPVHYADGILSPLGFLPA